MRCEFSLVHYREVLSVVAESYEPCLFRTWSEKHGSRKPRILMRHDVDHSLSMALDLARIEAEFGVPATYFIQLHSSVYTVSSAKELVSIRELVSLGHEVGLHYDTGYYASLGSDSEYALRRDLETLAELAQVEVRSVSRHNPIDSTDIANVGRLVPFDAYSAEFTKAAKYISDSSMSWREGCVCQHLPKLREYQVLTHPVWWCSPGATLRDKLLACAEDVARAYLQDIESLSAYYQKCLDIRSELDERHELRKAP